MQLLQQPACHSRPAFFNSRAHQPRSRLRSSSSSSTQRPAVQQPSAAAAAVDPEVGAYGVGRFIHRVDLMQFPDRYKWYQAKLAADDMPDWNPGRFVSIDQEAPGQRLLTLEVEVSRERVPLRNAYKAAGQTAVIRVNGGAAQRLQVASPPFPEELNKHQLWALKGDIFAGEKKVSKEPSSVLATVQLLVDKEGAPDVYNMRPDDMVSVGPFEGAGLDMRSSGVLGLFRFPTIVIFASGSGIATASALIESPLGVCTHISPTMRGDVRLYYVAPNRASLCLADRWDTWQEQFGVQVVTNTVSFMDAWDGDDSLVYEPESTAAFILTGGDEEAEAAALEVCKEAEITAIIRDSQPAAPSVQLDSVPKSFRRWMKDPEEDEQQGAGRQDSGNLSTDLTD